MTDRTHLIVELDLAQNEIICIAAARSGLSVSEYALETLLHFSKFAVNSDVPVTLSKIESLRFLTELNLPFQPNTTLANALKK